MSKEGILAEDGRNDVLVYAKYGKSKEDIKIEHEAEDGEILHVEFKKAVDEVSGRISLEWLKKGYLKKEAGSKIFAAQHQALFANSTRKTVFAEHVSTFCRFCG